MNREEIIGAIQEYVRNQKANYAVLIKGGWGVGKTFLYKNYLVDAKLPGKGLRKRRNR